MPALFRRDPLRALRLLFLLSLVVGGVTGLLQADTETVAVPALLVSGILALRAIEFRTGQLVPLVVDLIELGVVGAALLKLGSLEPMFGLIYSLLLFRAVTGSLRRVLPMIGGYIVVILAASHAVDIEVMPGMYQGMAIVTMLVYGMRALLLRLRDEQERHSRMLGDVLSRLPFPVVVTGPGGEVVLANPASTALTGPLDETRARTADGTPVDLRRLAPGEDGLELFIGEGCESKQVVAATVPSEHGMIVALLDVTAQRCYEERLEHAAYHDPLTGLPNRAQLWRRFGAAADRPYAMLLVDLDGFKAVNDTHGHLAGDELLCRVGERLRHVCAPDATVARLGGDEFAVLLPGARAEQATASAEAVRSIFAWDFPLSTGPVRVGGSIGYALGGPGRSPDDVLAGADAAMYADKHGRRPAAPLRS